ncbi:two-component system histidine kinase PnpS [Haloimpatiens sp. FM7330]|uniref:two-component system histidine kinase PnpS n=1 Tax=Haloimpatiens sp. FM7330 TaxID=3298610 RepID=UPI00362ACEF3
MKKKLMVYISTLILITLFVITILFISIVNFQYEQNIKQELKHNNKIVISLIKSNNIKSKKVFFGSNYKDSKIRITYIDKQGKVLFDSVADSNAMDNHSKRKEVQVARVKGEGYDKRTSKSTGKNTIYYASVLEDKYIIRSSMSMDVIGNFTTSYLRYYFLVVILVFCIAVLFSNKLSYIIIKPVKDLDFTTSRIAKGELNRRVNVTSQDEIGELGKNFNKMADELQYSLNDSIEKQTRLEAILRSMDSGIIAIDRNFKIIMINPYAEKIFDIDTNTIGKNLLDTIRNYDLEKIFISSNNDYNEIKITWPSERILRIKTADIINRSEHIGTVAVVQDITDIRKLENIRSQFVANVSHELKTPLTSIKGFAETLKYVDDSQTRNKFLNIINDEAERLTRLISDILVLSDIEQYRDNKEEYINVNNIIDNICSLIKNMAEKKGIELNIVGNKVPPILGNVDRFKQMMINLIDNAIKYSERGDKVYIGTKKEKNFCTIWVKDTGMGIQEEHIARLFERFYRVDKARSRSKGGTGLGLAIVKHIVLGLNGTIEVESEVGVGSKFIIKVPYNTEKVSN